MFPELGDNARLEHGGSVVGQNQLIVNIMGTPETNFTDESKKY